MKLTKHPVFLYNYFSKFMGILLYLLKCIFPCFWRWWMGFPDQQKSWLVPLSWPCCLTWTLVLMICWFNLHVIQWIYKYLFIYEILIGNMLTSSIFNGLQGNVFFFVRFVFCFVLFCFVLFCFVLFCFVFCLFVSIVFFFFFFFSLKFLISEKIHTFQAK